MTPPNNANTDAPHCPLPIPLSGKILLPHGGGGRWNHELIRDVFHKYFQNSYLDTGTDGANISITDLFAKKTATQELIFSTDSYVIRPLYFAGGSIAELAIYGTINDIAMCGGSPKFLSCSFIIEEGLDISILQDIARRMAEASLRCGVQIVTGDTKVVEKGAADGLFINTTGIGIKTTPGKLDPRRIQPGDQILISGDLGRHALAVVAQRENLQFSKTCVSDLAPLHHIVQKLMEASLNIRCLRDLTRGGLASALHEIKEKSPLKTLGITMDEAALPVTAEVLALCELMGFDSLQLANEGCFICILAKEDAHQALSIFHQQGHPLASIIGEFHERHDQISLITGLHTERVIDWPLGDVLPRIC